MKLAEILLITEEKRKKSLIMLISIIYTVEFAKCNLKFFSDR